METRGGKERRSGDYFLFRVLLSSASLPQACTHSHTHSTPSLPISCTYSIHPPRLKGAWRTSTHLSVLFFLFVLNHFFLSPPLFLSLPLSRRHSTLCVFLIKSAVNQITPLCNKLQTWEQRRRDTNGGGKGGEEWSWAVAMSRCREQDTCGW